MAKYINKDQAYKIVLHYGSYAASAKIADLKGIEIVRCNECKWWEKRENAHRGYCNKGEFMPTNDWFCADGAREDKA